MTATRNAVTNAVRNTNPDPTRPDPYLWLRPLTQLGSSWADSCGSVIIIGSVSTARAASR